MLKKLRKQKYSKVVFLKQHVIYFSVLKTLLMGVFLVAQWFRSRLPMQGTRVRALVQEDPTCRGATKPMRHNY